MARSKILNNIRNFLLLLTFRCSLLAASSVLISWLYFIETLFLVYSAIINIVFAYRLLVYHVPRGVSVPEVGNRCSNLTQQVNLQCLNHEEPDLPKPNDAYRLYHRPNLVGFSWRSCCCGYSSVEMNFPLDRVIPVNPMKEFLIHLF